MSDAVPTMRDVLDDIAKRVSNARAAAERDPEGVVHHGAVADMLEFIGNRVKESFDAFCASKDSFYCTNTECPLKKTLAEGGFDGACK